MRLTIVGSGDAFGSGGRVNTCFRIETAGPLDFYRLGVNGDLRANDIGPASDELGRGKALPRQRLRQAAREEVAQPPRLLEGLVHAAGLCHRGT